MYKVLFMEDSQCKVVVHTTNGWRRFRDPTDSPRSSQNQVLLVPLIILALQVQHSNPGFGAVRRMHWSLLAIRVH